MKLSLYHSVLRCSIMVVAMVTVNPVVAQNHYQRHRYDAPTTSQETRLPSTVDAQNAAQWIMLSQPALVNMIANSDSSRRAMLRIDTENDMTHGDYLHYEGRHRTQVAVTAGGMMPVKGIGTLFGQATYSRTTRRGTYQNYAVSPTDYAPYLVGDTISDGAVDYERYFISGGLSHTSGSWHYGVSGLYDGTAASKDNQPRRSVYSYWFRVALSVAKQTPDWLLSLKAYPEINKQTISASYTVGACRYLQSYGLGQWNRKESTSGYSYGRDMKTLGAGTEWLFSRPAKTAAQWTLTAIAAYNYRWMQSEETNFKNLYATKSHCFMHSLTVSRQLSPRLGIHFLLQGTALWRQGEENVYESQRQDDTQSLYDYVKVGTNRLYHLTTFSESLHAKAVWNAAERHAMSIALGATMDNYHERYDMPQLSVENLSLSPNLSLGYAYTGRVDYLEVLATASMHAALSNDYAASLDATSTTELAQTYIPYLLRSEDNASLALSATYSHALRRGTVGIELQGQCLKRHSAAYQQVFSSIYAERRHKQWQLSASLFYCF